MTNEPAPLRMTVALREAELRRVLGGAEVTLRARGSEGALEVVVMLRREDAPALPAPGGDPRMAQPTPALLRPPRAAMLADVAALPWPGRWQPTVEEVEAARRVAAEVERERSELRYSPGEPR